MLIMGIDTGKINIDMITKEGEAVTCLMIV